MNWVRTHVAPNPAHLKKGGTRDGVGPATALYWNLPTLTRVRYRDAGVNIDEADRALSSIKKLARQTFTRGVLTDIGSFGAAYKLAGFRKPVLVSSADGVGTKLKVAFLTGRHDTVGEDLNPGEPGTA